LTKDSYIGLVLISITTKASHCT